MCQRRGAVIVLQVQRVTHTVFRQGLIVGQGRSMGSLDIASIGNEAEEGHPRRDVAVQVELDADFEWRRYQQYMRAPRVGLSKVDSPQR